jgi:hypothetical protein
MKLQLTFYVSAVLLLGSSVAMGQAVTMERVVPYAADAEVATKVRTECVKLQGQLAAYTQEYAKANGMTVHLIDGLAKDASGRVLVVEITEAISAGNPFIGHRKFSRIQGTLFEDGAAVASFKGQRNSMGGAFGGYKGSCSVLGRTVKALGQDVAGWLMNPVNGARLGDM